MAQRKQEVKEEKGVGKEEEKGGERNKGTLARWRIKG